MENSFNKIAKLAQKDVYVVFAENLIDSLNAAERVSSLIKAAEDQDANIFFVDMIDVVHMEHGSDNSLYAQNIHGYTQDSYKKACHIFQKQLQDKYGLESSCLTSKYSGGAQHALFSMFEKEDANNVIAVTGEGLEEMVRGNIGMARSGPEGMRKHVQVEEVNHLLPENITSFRCANKSCPNQTL
tara:strand:+ start:248046 stop:248600 length:555 start_codon:yes stop_codon:yes gene_type:complete